MKRTNNIFQKVKFYQSDKAAGKYSVPVELVDLVPIDDNKTLKERITEMVNQEF
jgi:hypothetical protein